jgi:hypothetical protein
LSEQCVSTKASFTQGKQAKESAHLDATDLGDEDGVRVGARDDGGELRVRPVAALLRLSALRLLDSHRGLRLELARTENVHEAGQCDGDDFKVGVRRERRTDALRCRGGRRAAGHLCAHPGRELRGRAIRSSVVARAGVAECAEAETEE